MADEKRKIDLKARLGKKTVKGGPSVPPPMGIPRPVGVPVPPFGGPKRKGGPKVDANDPYAAISADHAPAKDEPKTLKVEMSQEVVEAQRKGRAKIVVLAIATAAVGALLGFTIGGRLESNKGAKAAVAGAKQLATKIDDTNAVIIELADTLTATKDKLKSNKYPEEEVKKLGGIDIPFSGADLNGKGIGRYEGKTQTLLFDFASRVSAANDQKGSLHRFLGAKKTVTDYLQQQAKPKVRWSVFVIHGPHGPWASMQRLPKPFLASSKEKKDGKDYVWPEDFKIKDGGKTHDLKRYTRGDPMGSEPKIIPVDPGTQTSVCPSDVMGKLSRQVYQLELVLRGNKTPGQEKQGLMELGELVLEKLRKIGRP